MVYTVYIIQNKQDRKYIGQTNNIELRIKKHNNNEVISTKNRGPWKIIFRKEFTTRKESMKYEKFLKNQKGGIGLKKIMF
ncbi:MAG: GIY-YIG nuclease family protein [Patescibacteria group bacterium]